MIAKKCILLFCLACCVSSLSAQSFSAEVAHFRAEYKADFLKEKRSPFYEKADRMEGLRFYSPKKKYQVAGTFERTADAPVFKMATYSGQTRDYVQYGWIHFKWKGADKKVAVYQSLRTIKMEGYEDYLFIPFKDFTNSKATYGGGRYIDMRLGDIDGDGKVIVDFNRCYNPWCAFSDGYSCPIPPKENHLTFPIKAGEKAFKREH